MTECDSKYLGHRTRTWFRCFYSAFFLADESKYLFANNSKMAGHRKLKSSHNVGKYPLQLTMVCQISAHQGPHSMLFIRTRIFAKSAKNKIFVAFGILCFFITNKNLRGPAVNQKCSWNSAKFSRISKSGQTTCRIPQTKFCRLLLSFQTTFKVLKGYTNR